MSTAAPTSQPPPPAEPFWTPARVAIREWLRANAPPLGDLHNAAVQLVYGPPIPGRIRLVCHAMREICNRLPDYIAPESTTGTFQWKNRLDALSDHWAREGPFETPSPGATPETPSATEPRVAIARPLFVHVDAVLRDHVDSRERYRDTVVRLFVAIAPEARTVVATLEPAVNEWMSVQQWFVKYAHDAGREVPLPTDQELRIQLERFELSLSSLVAGVLRAVDEIDEALAEANR